MVDRNGIPLAIRLSAANVNDCRMLQPTVDAIVSIMCPSGRRRKRPAKLHADKGYDYPFCRALLRRRHIAPRIAARASSAAIASVVIAGWSSAPWPGSTTFDA